jgi:hypothetical protein
VGEKQEESREVRLTATDGADPVLCRMVSLVDQERGVQLPVTLQMGGALVSGHLVGVREYAVGIEAEVVRAASEASMEGAESLRGKAARVLGEQPDLSGLDDYTPSHIHLRNVTVWTPGGAATAQMQAPWWRGRLAAVEAFVLGKPE